MVSNLISTLLTGGLSNSIEEQSRGASARAQLDGCGGCTYCCWAYNVELVPLLLRSGQPFRETQPKPAYVSCRFQRVNWGCEIHEHSRYPRECRVYRCPYLLQQGRPQESQVITWFNGGPFPYLIHRPDTFLDLLQQFMATGDHLIVPSVPKLIPVERARELVEQTRSILAASEKYAEQNGSKGCVGYAVGLALIGDRKGEMCVGALVPPEDFAPWEEAIKSGLNDVLRRGPWCLAEYLAAHAAHEYLRRAFAMLGQPETAFGHGAGPEWPPALAEIKAPQPGR